MDLRMEDAPETDPWALALAQGVAALGLILDGQQLARLLGFLDLLARWNRRFNLTAIRDASAMVSHHLLDSLAVAPYLQGESVLDLGTGAGLPGLPLAIAEPSRRFWLLDSNGKKVRFVRQAVLELGLSNVEPVQSRIESYRPGRKFSTIVVRAVASTPESPCPDGPPARKPRSVPCHEGSLPRGGACPSSPRRPGSRDTAVDRALARRRAPPDRDPL